MKQLSVFKMISLSLACALGLGAPTSASAQQAVSLAGSVKVERTTIEGGEERTVLSAPDNVVPGDKLLFSTAFRNGGAETVTDFEVVNPIPAAVRLGSETGDFEVSVDGGNTFGALADFTLPDESGGQRPAALEDVTHLRWTFDTLAPGEAGTLEYSAFVR